MSSTRTHHVALSSMAPKSCALNTLDRAASTYLWARKNRSPMLIVTSAASSMRAVQVRRRSAYHGRRVFDAMLHDGDGASDCEAVRQIF